MAAGDTREYRRRVSRLPGEIPERLLVAGRQHQDGEQIARHAAAAGHQLDRARRRAAGDGAGLAQRRGLLAGGANGSALSGCACEHRRHRGAAIKRRRSCGSHPIGGRCSLRPCHVDACQRALRGAARRFQQRCQRPNGVEAALLEVPAAASGADLAGGSRYVIRSAAVQAGGARRQPDGGAPTLPPTPTAFPRLPAGAVSGGQPSQPDNSRHCAVGWCNSVSHCSTRINAVWHGPCSNMRERRLL